MGGDLITEPERQSIIDDEHLRLLSITYWIMGGFTVLYSLLVAAYFGLLSTVFLAIPAAGGDGGEAPPEFVGWMFLGVGAFAVVLCGAFAAYEIAVGFWIRDRRHRVATIVLGALFCPSLPFGTALGVSTLMVMLRPSVKSLYDAGTVTNSDAPVPPVIEAGAS